VPEAEGDKLRVPVRDPDSQEAWQRGGGAGGELAIAWRDQTRRVKATSTGDQLRVYLDGVSEEKIIDSKDLQKSDPQKPDPQKPDQPPIDSIALEPTGLWVGVCRSGQAEVELWHVDEKKRLPFRIADGPCESLSWLGREGGTLIARSRQSVWFFETGTWRQTGVIAVPAPSGGRAVIAISPDGRFLATPTISREIKLFRILDPSGRCEAAATLQPPRLQSLSALRFCGKDGRFLVAGTVDGELQVWDLVRLRHELDPLGLDFDSMPLPPAEPAHPIRKVDFTD
jgi:WD40 repeat protein